MPSLIGPIPAAVLMQDGACGDAGTYSGGGATGSTGLVATNATPNGNALNLQGAIRGLLIITVDDPEFPPVVGTLTFEESHDGDNFVASKAVSLLSKADDSAYLVSISAPDLPVTLKIDPLSGPATLRARVSTAFDQPISVIGLAIGR